MVDNVKWDPELNVRLMMLDREIESERNEALKRKVNLLQIEVESLRRKLKLVKSENAQLKRSLKEGDTKWSGKTG